MKKWGLFLFVIFVIGGISFFHLQAEQRPTKVLLNVAYDVIRDFYKDYNPWFLQTQHLSDEIRLLQSHGGASKQAIAVASGLPADVVTLTQSSDIDILVEKGLVAQDWQQRLPNNSSPFGSVMVLLVQKGNPKQIKDWDDLVRDDVSVIFANPKTSANGRFAYLAALAYAQQHFSTVEQQQQFLQKLLANVPILEAGARGATITFTQRHIGDVLITPENEAAMAAQALGQESFDIVYPSLSLYTPVFVAEVQANTQLNNNTTLAQDYLATLWSEPAQQLAAKHYFRPHHPQVFAQYQQQFPNLPLVDIEQTFGDWQHINEVHFFDNGWFDRLYSAD